jgi:hypothetical protein
MPKVYIVVRPSGLYNGAEWPEVGEPIDVPDVVADDLVASGHAEKSKAAANKAVEEAEAEPEVEQVETRPAKADGVEKRGPRVRRNAG